MQWQSSIFNRLHAGYDWWLAQLSTCVPAFVRRLVFKPQQRVGFLFGSDRVDAVFESSHHSPVACGLFDSTEVERTRLATSVQKWQSRSTPIGVYIPTDKCLVRKRRFPKAASGDLQELLRLDLARSVPFQPENIASDFLVSPDGSSLDVTQIVVRKDIRDDHVDVAIQHGIRPEFISAWDTHDHAPLPVDLRDASAAENANQRFKFSFGLAYTLAVISVVASGVFVMFENQSITLEVLRPQLEQTQKKLLAVRKHAKVKLKQSAAESKFVQRKSNAKTLVQIWAELATYLPDTAWISDLRKTGDVIHISGYSKAASELISVLDASELFKNVGLAAPVTVDPRNQGERFYIRLEVDTGMAAPVRTSARSERT